MGDIRGKQPIIQNIDRSNVDQTITYITNIKSPIIYRRNKVITSFTKTSEVRREEINRIEFAILREFIDKELKEMTWIDKDFKSALLIVTSVIPSNQRIDLEKFPDSQKDYIKIFLSWHKKGRVTHLLIPRLRNLHEAELDDREKWKSFYSYFENLLLGQKGSRVDVWKSKDKIFYTEQIMGTKAVMGFTEIIVESAGAENVPHAIEIVSDFISKDENWDIWRVDFTMVESRTEGDFSFGGRKYISKIFIELFDWGAYGYAKHEIEDRNDKIDLYLDKVYKRCNTAINESLDYYKEKENRVNFYQDFKGKLKQNKFCLISAEHEHTYNAIFLSSVFRFYNPYYDYIGFIRSKESKCCIHISFSSLPLKRMIDVGF
jgi:hypothetical protein